MTSLHGCQNRSKVTLLGDKVDLGDVIVAYSPVYDNPHSKGRAALSQKLGVPPAPAPSMLMYDPKHLYYIKRPKKIGCFGIQTIWTPGCF